MAHGGNYRIQDIASCYVGDIGIKQKKQVIMPTLIIHLKPDNQQVSSPRSFRRRSHENPYARSAPTALFFRPDPDNGDSLQQWAKEIQFYLNVCAATQSNTTPITPTQHSFPEISENSSLFFVNVNGEPNTALLSPSLRSKCSDLSSIPSDRRSISSSSISELPSPRVDEHAHEHHGRAALHIATNSEEFDPQELENRAHFASASDTKRFGRRETILDRYLSSYAVLSPIDTPMSSIARFEALMTERETLNSATISMGGRKNSLISLGESMSMREMDIPKRIPSPTLRALEFVSTGINHPEDILESTQSSPRLSLALPDDYRPRSNSAYSNYSHSRRNSDSSVGAQSAAASSVTGGGASSVVGSLSGFTLGHGQLSCASPRSKRHSIGDFSMRNTATGSGYISAMTAVGAGGSTMARPDSISEFTHDFNDEATLARLAQSQNFISRNNKPPSALLGPILTEF